MSHLLKESTQGIGSLWKESAQGVSSLLREISTATSVVPGFTPRADGTPDPLPVLPRSTSAGEKQSNITYSYDNVSCVSLVSFFIDSSTVPTLFLSPDQANKMSCND